MFDSDFQFRLGRSPENLTDRCTLLKLRLSLSLTSKPLINTRLPLNKQL
jgi:hypothetical protein